MYFCVRLVVFSLVKFALPYMLFLLEMSRDSTLLTSKSLKRGDVETKARSSVSPPPQVKIKLKLTASR